MLIVIVYGIDVETLRALDQDPALPVLVFKPLHLENESDQQDGFDPIAGKPVCRHSQRNAVPRDTCLPERDRIFGVINRHPGRCSQFYRRYQ